MKKILFLVILFLFVFGVNAEKFEVDLYKCVDGDTAWFTYDNNNIKARFLAIDTPESTTKKEKYGYEASLFTCNKLKDASIIHLEYDKNSDKQDKYKRELVWVFVDDKLLQEQILKEGLGEVKYIYGDYKYLPILYKAEEKVKKEKINIWEDYNYFVEHYLIYIILLIGVLVYLIFPKTRKDLEKLYKKKVKNKLKL